jgi:Protein of unknown function (DUF1566)
MKPCIAFRPYFSAAAGVLTTLLLLSFPAAHAQTCVGGVRASNPSSTYEIDVPNGTVTDVRTGLMWDRCPRGQSGVACAGAATTFTWGNALPDAANANVANYKGYNDWRLPNVKELESLVETCRSSPSINESAFPATPSSGFWSGSPVAGVTTGAWYLSLSLGSVYLSGRSSAHRVRLVRAGQ